MGMRASSLFDHTGDQLRRLCDVIGVQDTDTPVSILRDILGPAGARSLAEPPLWPSDVSDDHTPIEFSLALDNANSPALRLLAEIVSDQPGNAANLRAARTLLDSLAARFSLSLGGLDRIHDLFLNPDHDAVFSLWYSLIFRAGTAPDTKVYFSPDARGRQRAPELVAEALRRLDLAGAYRTVVEHAVRPGQLGDQDQFAFFALDLHDRPQSRAKVYLAHQHAHAADMMRAAQAVDGVEVEQLREFCELVGGTTDRFAGRPLVSSYTFVEGDTDRPSGYSLYLPIRDYVTDDEQALSRVSALLSRYGIDPTVINDGIAAVARRPLRAGVGLIAHVSLRLGRGTPGVTVYLSSEAYSGPAGGPATSEVDQTHSGQTLDPVQ
ncbi:MAG TPA: tryptophan dimethylallyltransferase family protein [Pseudonocardiaceae bacterium]|jgi:DMATS type aromatic prenyltransferase|nr:tryptophan dimethylallyltransferase family protein [Pseudonocardiaceae bacterium]